MTDIAQQLGKVQQRIIQSASRAGRNAAEIKLLAVSKTRPLSDLMQAVDAGQYAFGENYLQEAIEKIPALRTARPAAPLEWHFIGPIQSNKTAAIAEHFDWVHSVDRLKIAQRLNEQRNQIPLNICLQVNISQEASKSGCSPAELLELAQQVSKLPRLRLRGLMAIPASRTDSEQQRHPFRQLRVLLESLNKQGFTLDTLSMGMSADLEAAILEGATLVRIGTDIFGPRNQQANKSD